MCGRTMRTNYAVWIGLFILAILVTLAAKYYAYFPGDVAVALLKARDKSLD